MKLAIASVLVASAAAFAPSATRSVSQEHRNCWEA
jgi:hypothetical protein